MNTETRTKLSSESLDCLKDLIQLNIDSQKGFEEAAEKCDDLNISSLFRNLSDERSRQAAELQGYVKSHGVEPDADGSFAGTVHRAWMNLKSALGGGNQAILNEAERGEDYILDKYRTALEEKGIPDQELVRRHYSAVKAAHDRVRDLRDNYNE